MPKYLVSYQQLSDFQVVVTAENEDAAKDLVIDSPTQTTCIIDGEGVECEPDWIESDMFYDTIDVSEVEE